MKEFLALFCSNCTACGGNGAISSPENWWSVRTAHTPRVDQKLHEYVRFRFQWHCQLHIELLMLQKKFASARKLCFSEIKKACLTYILPDT